MAKGVLEGVKVLEFEAIGPVPFGAMMLADMGADVLRLQRPQRPNDLGIADADRRPDVLGRNRRCATLDMKAPGATQAALSLLTRADIVLEGFRPGTMERLGLGPEAALAANPRLVYGRMTGWGQTGPLAKTAGHDINYLALSGVLSMIGEQERKPVVPLNLLADYGGGGALLAQGVLAAYVAVLRGTPGQVVDVSMVEGAAQLSAVVWAFLAAGQWNEARGTNVLDGGAPWYDTYETQDGRHVAVGAVEARFYAELIAKLCLDPAKLPAQHDRSGWPQLRAALAHCFASQPRSHWEQLFAGSDACVSPVLTPTEAAAHPHNRARGSFAEVSGVTQPMPAPRFSTFPSPSIRPPARRGEGGLDALVEWGIAPNEIERLRRLGIGLTPDTFSTPQ